MQCKYLSVDVVYLKCVCEYLECRCSASTSSVGVVCFRNVGVVCTLIVGVQCAYLEHGFVASVLCSYPDCECVLCSYPVSVQCSHPECAVFIPCERAVFIP